MDRPSPSSRLATAIVLAVACAGCQQIRPAAVCTAPTTTDELINLVTREAAAQLNKLPAGHQLPAVPNPASLKPYLSISDQLLESVDQTTGKVTCSAKFSVRFAPAPPDVLARVSSLLRAFVGGDWPADTSVSGGSQRANFSRQKGAAGSEYYYAIDEADPVVGAVAIAAMINAVISPSSNASLTQEQSRTAQAQLAKARELCGRHADELGLSEADERDTGIIESYEAIEKLSPAFLAVSDRECLNQSRGNIEAKINMWEAQEAEAAARKSEEPEAEVEADATASNAQ